MVTLDKGLPVLRMHNVEDAATEELVGGVGLQHRQPRRVHGEEGAVRRDCLHAFRLRIEDGPQTLFALAQRVLRPLAVEPRADPPRHELEKRAIGFVEGCRPPLPAHETDRAVGFARHRHQRAQIALEPELEMPGMLAEFGVAPSFKRQRFRHLHGSGAGSAAERHHLAVALLSSLRRAHNVQLQLFARRAGQHADGEAEPAAPHVQHGLDLLTEREARRRRHFI